MSNSSADIKFVYHQLPKLIATLTLNFLHSMPSATVMYLNYVLHGKIHEK